MLSLSLGAVAAIALPRPSAAQEATSESEVIGRSATEAQLYVWAEHLPLKMRFAVYIRTLQTDFRHALGLYDSDDWEVKLKVHLHGDGRAVHSGDDVMIGGEAHADQRFSLQMDVKIHDRFEMSDFRAQILRLLLIEQMLQAYLEQPENFKTSKFEPPAWLIHGFDQYLHHRRLGKPSYFYDGFIESNQLLKVDEILQLENVDQLTPTSLALFRASSAVLVGALCEQRDGGASLRALLQELAIAPDSNCSVLFRKHFPALRETGGGIEKWWALQLASVSQQQSFEYLSPEETEKMIDQAMTVRFSAQESRSAEDNEPELPQSHKAGRQLLDRFKAKRQERKQNRIPEREAVDFQGHVSEYRKYTGLPNWQKKVQGCATNASLLEIKAFPLYRKLLRRYSAVCNKIAAGDLATVDAELAQLHQRRQQISASLSSTRDYLNHFEATRSPKLSDAFDSYFRFIETPSVNPSQPGDAIHRAMDRVEKQIAQ